MWEEQNFSEAFAKKQIVPKESILSYLSSNQSDIVESSETDRNWVKNFCSAKKSRWFVEIDDDFLKDERNYKNIDTFLSSHFKKDESTKVDSDKNSNSDQDESGKDNAEFDRFYKLAKYLIRTKNDSVLKEEEKLDSQIYSQNEEDEKFLENIAETLYGLLHARYILTNAGLIKMAQKYQRCVFGRCLRIGCKSNPVLPIGLSDKPYCFPVKIFCPLCHDIYNLPDEFEFLENTDGAFFGKSFPSIFMLNFPQFCDESSYIYPRGPRIYQNKVQDNDFKIPDENSEDPIPNEYVEITFNRRSVLLTKQTNQT